LRREWVAWLLATLFLYPHLDIFMEESTKLRVLITDDCHPVLIDRLESLGYEVDFRPEITYEACCAAIQAYTGLIINSKILVNQAFLDSAVQLRWLGRLGSGMEIVDQAYAAKRGVSVMSSPEGNCNAVAEQAVGMLLCLSNQLLTADREVRRFIWQREARRGWEITGKTLGIIGFGHTGKAFAAKWQGWNVRVLAFDKYRPNGYASEYPFVQETDLETLLEESDIVSFHLPLTAETRYYEQEKIYRLCKLGVVFINTSRGQVLETSSLIEGLKSGRVGGACLDVFENEKVHTFGEKEHQVYKQLYKLPQVVLSPHIAGWTHESKLRMAEILAEQIGQLEVGKK
jgi:D-3-phosphoglycerate dehydrogenase / 2-oxoglutarate reductase